MFRRPILFTLVIVIPVVALLVVAAKIPLSPPFRTAVLTRVAASTEETTAPPVAETKEVTMLGGTPDKVTLTAEEQQFVDLVNKERKDRGLTELTVAPLLVKTAREKSQEMHDLKYWGHESPDPKKKTALRRVMFYLPEPPKSMTIGENLCYTSKVDVATGHKALMDSPTHRRNILNPDYRYIGIGIYIADDGRCWTTEHFAAIQY